MYTGKMSLVKGSGNFVAAEPGSAEFLERSLRAAADGDAGVLQDFDARIKDGTFRGAEIWRRRNPLDAGTKK
jgi:hypothetical protein